MPNGKSARRGDIARIKAEIRGEIPIPLDNERTFILSARADRIERRHDGSYAILDYKTGQPPTGKQVRMGLSPQLTLEAAILREGGFADIAGGCLGQRTRLCPAQRQQSAGRRTNPLELKIKPERCAATARRRPPTTRGRSSKTLIRAFEDESQAYTSLNLSMWSNRYGSLRRSRPHQGMVRGRRIGDRGMVKAPRPIPAAVRATQARASDPAASAFVSANAGSGKTHVLVQRVIRLLLAGVPPEKILCITFTKAAAANMAERVFSTLGHWVTLDDAALDAAIREAGIAHPDARLRLRGPQTVRLRAGDAGRAEGADHPRAVHPAAAAISVRGQRAGALCRARRPRPERDDGARQSRGAAGSRRAIPTARPGAR